MYLCYFDEAGDDGYPKTSSPIFLLSCIYMHHNAWRPNFESIKEFRRNIKKEYSLPVKQEFHTSDFLKDRDPYHDKYPPAVRKEILIRFFEHFSSLELKIINVVIDKTRFKSVGYPVLEKSLTYNVQRIENDLSIDSNNYLIITDEGRLATMQKHVRKIQRINYIPSKYQNRSYRKEISNLIEDPLAKKSSESFFIQIADSVATIVYLYALQNLCKIKQKWANRVLQVLSYGDEKKLLNLVRSRLNLKASSNKFGIVCYPK